MAQGFEYTPFNAAPYTASVAELLAHQNDAQARAAVATAQANAHAREVSGSVWGQAIQSAAQIPQQVMQQRRLDQDSAQKRELQGQQITTGKAEAAARTEATQRAAQQRVVTTIGTLAKGADSAEDFAARVTDLAHLGALPPDVASHITEQASSGDWASVQKRYVDFAAQFASAVTLAPGAKSINPVSGATLAENPAVRPPVSVAPGHTLVDPSTAQPVFTAPNAPQRPVVVGPGAIAVNPQTGDTLATGPAAKRTESEQALDAFAKSLSNGKTRAEQLTDAERQQFVKRDAETKAATAFTQHQRERNYDVAHPVPLKGKSQDELEQEARGVLQREFSSRSGGLGAEDTKVNLAIHLRALLDQFDGKPMPAQIHAELAMGLARLTSPSGQVGIELEKEFKQKTAQEGLAKGIAYLTGDPTLVNATPEKLREMLGDSIQRQGAVAEQNRQTYLNAMLSMLPTQLDPARREAISKGTQLNEMPAPKGAPAVGTTRDGLTWKRGSQGWGWYR